MILFYFFTKKNLKSVKTFFLKSIEIVKIRRKNDQIKGQFIKKFTAVIYWYFPIIWS